MTAMAWAIALSVLSAVCYATAAVAQEHFAGARRGVLRWALPLLLTGAGAGLHVVALQFGTVGVVQALGALTLIFALPIAALRTRRRITGAAWRHAWLTVGGLAGLLALSTAGSGSLSATSAQWLSVFTGIAVVGIAVAAHRAASPTTKSLLLAGAAGVAFGVSSVLTKTVMSDLAAGFGSASMLSAGAIAALAAAGQILSQQSYRAAGLAAPLAMVSVANPAVAGVIGFLLLGDSVRFGTTGAILAVGAAVVAARGIIGLTAQSSARDATSADAAGAESGTVRDSRPELTRPELTRPELTRPELTRSAPWAGGRKLMPHRSAAEGLDAGQPQRVASAVTRRLSPEPVPV